MSRLAKKLIPLASGVQVQLAGSRFTVKGPKGTLALDLPAGVVVAHDTAANKLEVSLDPAVETTGATHGLYWSLINNLVTGVTKGFEKRLSLVGVGYRAAVQGKEVDLQLGYSHPTKVPIPEGIQVAIDKGTTIVITGSDKRVVGHFAAQIREVRPPEPYKGKGVRYENEVVRKKAGKAAKGKA